VLIFSNNHKAKPNQSLPAMKKYYYAKGDKRLGPFTLEELIDQDLNKETLVWHDGLTDWSPLSTFPELVEKLKTVPPPLKVEKSAGSKTGFKKGTIIAFALIGLLLLVGGVFFYPKWSNTRKFNQAVSAFMATDSIQFGVFNELATKNYSNAYYILGLHYQRADDSIKAKAAFENALKTEYRIPALFELYRVNQSDSNEYKKSISQDFDKWVAAIKPTDWLSQRAAAKIYQIGVGVEENTRKAIEYFELAANCGSVWSMVLLGNAYTSDGEFKDYAKALTWYRKAADLGYAHAMSSLGFLYFDGTGVSVDYKEAFKWFSKSSSKNCAYGETCMGMVYMGGKGVKQDFDSAKYWFQRASNNQQDKSEFGQAFKRAGQAMQLAAIQLESASKSSASQSRVQGSSSSGGGSYNEYVSCYYCGRGFYQQQGYSKGTGMDCAKNYKEALQEIAIAYKAGYSEDNLKYLLNSYNNGEWYCTRKCVYESGNCVD